MAVRYLGRTRITPQLVPPPPAPRTPHLTRGFAERVHVYPETVLSDRWKMNKFTPENLNPAVLNVQYAVRGELAIKAEQHRNKLKEGDHGLPFDKVISSNIGNPQQKGLDQPPITFPRQVCSQAAFVPNHVLNL